MVFVRSYSNISYYTIPCYAILFYTVLYSSIPYEITLWRCIAVYGIISYYTVFYFIFTQRTYIGLYTGLKRRPCLQAALPVLPLRPHPRNHCRRRKKRGVSISSTETKDMLRRAGFALPKLRVESIPGKLDKGSGFKASRCVGWDAT